MTPLLISLTLLFMFAAAIVALPFIHSAWRRIGVRDTDLQLWRVMARRDIVPDNVPATRAKLARAVRRCVRCPNIEQCDDWLAANAQDGLADFCPNATLLEELRAVRS